MLESIKSNLHQIIFSDKLFDHRLRPGTDEFKMGIQKSTLSINNCLKNVKKKIKVDINVVDTCQSNKMLSQMSFIFPQASVDSKHDQKQKSRGRFMSTASCLSISSTPGRVIVTHSHPFKEDLEMLTVILKKYEHLYSLHMIDCFSFSESSEKTQARKYDK